MGARQKLNAAHLNGSLLVAALAGALARSWLVFFAALALLLAASLLAGEIRPRRRRRGEGDS